MTAYVTLLTNHNALLTPILSTINTYILYPQLQHHQTKIPHTSHHIIKHPYHDQPHHVHTTEIRTPNKGVSHLPCNPYSPVRRIPLPRPPSLRHLRTPEKPTLGKRGASWCGGGRVGFGCITSQNSPWPWEWGGGEGMEEAGG